MAYQPTIEQSGTVTPGHVLAWTTDGVAQDAGTPSNPFAITLGLQSNSLVSFGIANAPTSGAYSQVGLGFDPATGNAALSIASYDGAPNVGFVVIINGVTYAFPGAGGGDVVGPGSSTDGDVALFNGTSGALLKDGGNARVAGSLSILTGAFGSGNSTQAVNLSDFERQNSGNDGWQYFRDPEGNIMQSYHGTNTTGADTINFPLAFPNACSNVIASDGYPTQWGADAPQAVIWGTQQLSRTGFALYAAQYNNIADGFILTGSLVYRYIAYGY
jgi:hypothetical protein